MSNAPSPVTRGQIQNVAAGEDEAARQSLAETIAVDWERNRPIVTESLDDSTVRRWARSCLAPRLSNEPLEELATRLLQWKEDFAPTRRDRTTGQLVAHLPWQILTSHLPELAGSNAATALWDRVAAKGDETALSAARDVLTNADAAARETTLHLLVLDPYGSALLGREHQDQLLKMALDDPDTEIRGLAADVVAADMPELILERWSSAPLDGSERVRMAFWQAALVHRPDAAFEYAGALVLDPERDHTARRTALIAVGKGSSTRQMSPLLQALLRGDDEVLADDAAQLMWRHHRAPDVANAAAESPFEGVRDLAERLLHPERGSPAAGGSRPGDPTRTGEILGQIGQSEDWRGPEPEE